jgi:tripartite-type tricarboxylate transporter receptor subunit TctC
VVKRLNGALQEILDDAETKKKLLALGIEARAGPPEAIEERLKSDIDKWRAVIEKAKIPKQ